MAFTSIQKTANYDETPDAVQPANATTRSTFRKNTSIADSSTDVLPIFNVAMWAIPNTLVLRYNRAKTVARPPMSRLLPSVTCIYDETKVPDAQLSEDDYGDQRCSGTMGNPGVKPFTNKNQNLSLEWYVNKDTMFSAAAFKQKGVIGAPNGFVARDHVKVFEGSDQVDPVSGIRLADMEFSFNQWINLPPSTRRGVEFGSKTAFTFLPSVLRYTGLDMNYTRVRSDQGVPTLDLITAEQLPVVGEPKYSYNASLWYDDGAFSARVALQVVAKRYGCFAPCTGTNIGVNNFPADNVQSVRLAYNPGNPVFSDATRFIDAKMAYKFKNGMEIFIEGRNLTNQQTSNSTGGYEDYSDGTPNLYTATYSGRRIMVGLNIRSPQ
jgi:TonB-dependent receptor